VTKSRTVIADNTSPFPMGRREGRASALQMQGIRWGVLGSFEGERPRVRPGALVGRFGKRPRLRAGACRAGLRVPGLTRDLVDARGKATACTV